MPETGVNSEFFVDFLVGLSLSLALVERSYVDDVLSRVLGGLLGGASVGNLPDAKVLQYFFGGWAQRVIYVAKNASHLQLVCLIQHIVNQTVHVPLDLSEISANPLCGDRRGSLSKFEW